MKLKFYACEYAIRVKMYTIFMFIVYIQTSYSQHSCKPSLPPGNFTNSVNFNFSANEFYFHYYGSDGNLTYKYKPQGNSSFSNVECIVNNSYVFNPVLGGITLDANGTEIFPWTPGVNISLINVSASGDTIIAKWRMKYGSDSLRYDYKLHISGRTLVIDAIAYQPKAMRLTLDRSEGTLNPKTIAIPYLPMFNVLYTHDNNGNEVFISAFFDWEITKASEILPLDFYYSPTSLAYSQHVRYLRNTNGQRNILRERIYITVSPSIVDVFPNIPNPPSPYKILSGSYLVLDSWHHNGFYDALNDLTMLKNSDIDSLWIVYHVWQNGGYDNQYPDVIPANPLLGGDAGLNALSNFCAVNNYLFSLHENYIDFYPNAPSFNPNHLSKDENGNPKPAWFNPYTGIQSYHMKPSMYSYYSGIFSPQIHTLYSTNSSFLDVHTAINPSYLIDHDANVPNSNMVAEVIQINKQLCQSLRSYHQGPLSGEGKFHFIYAGFVDDVEAQINTGRSDEGYWQGVRLPLLVDFKLHKIHPLMVMHGVGYYERFFSKNDGEPFFHSFPIDTVLMYIATELAYGNGGFIPYKDRVSNFLQTALLEYRHVLSAQRFYANANVVSITYDDNGQEVDASQYIKNHPTTFDDINSPYFMSKIHVVYDNGTEVYVNRHPSQTWTVTPSITNARFNFHAIINSIDSLGIAVSPNINSWVLPPKNGWLVITPTPTDIEKVNLSDNKYYIFPNPGNGFFMLSSDNTASVNIQIYDLLGRKISSVHDVKLVPYYLIDLSNQQNGMYFINIQVGDKNVSKKVVIQK